MLTIRREQMQVLASAGSLVERICTHLLQRHARYVTAYAPEVLRARVVRGVELAQQYRMEDEGSVATFVTLMFRVAPNFHWHPRIAPILGNRRWPGQRRLRRLSQLSTAEWQEVARAYDPAAWT